MKEEGCFGEEKGGEEKRDGDEEGAEDGFPSLRCERIGLWLSLAIEVAW